MERIVHVDVCVIGGGISGIATAKCLQDEGLGVVVLEQSDRIGGLWAFRETAEYGVMRFTHINVSKYNYCFSDYPFPDDTLNFPHHSTLLQYINDYAVHNGLDSIIRLRTKVVTLERIGDLWNITTARVEQDKTGAEQLGESEVFTAKFVAIASGHHATPNIPAIPGQESFKGEIIHSSSYKDAITNRIIGKRVLIVGIGNSAVDVAVDVATTGRAQAVYLSTRSGAWIFPNYIFGVPSDLYACRAFLWLPWRFATIILEMIISLVMGNPKSYKLNPKMRMLQSQPTVSPTLIHHLQRGHVQVKPDVSRVEGSTAHFADGSRADVDSIVLCTGYHIGVPYLSEKLRSEVIGKDQNTIKLFKNVFSPAIGPTLAFIGFVQPASGGILSMSETQARWFAEICKGRVALPGQRSMLASVQRETAYVSKRWTSSARHTVQRDPIIYNDEIAAMFGARPRLWRHPRLIWRLLVGSSGAAQWRLDGPGKWHGAPAAVRSVPVSGVMHYSALVALSLIVGIIASVLCAIL